MAHPESTHGPVLIRDYLLAHDGNVLAAATLIAGGAFLFIWFLGSLREVLRSAEGEGSSLSLVTFGAGIATIVLATIGVPPAAALSWNHTAALADDGLVRALWNLQSSHADSRRGYRRHLHVGGLDRDSPHASAARGGRLRRHRVDGPQHHLDLRDRVERRRCASRVLGIRPASSSRCCSSRSQAAAWSSASGEATPGCKDGVGRRWPSAPIRS